MTKIAFATDDLKTISSHFGQAEKYLVCTIENNQVTAQEERAKASHQHGHGESHEHHQNEHHHSSMAQSISDCQIVVARGMGNPAYESMKSAGLQPILTQFQTIEEAINAYLEGRLEHQDKHVHIHK
jgi:predicted Fe-Mo cluster-binding NifX family protein